MCRIESDSLRPHRLGAMLTYNNWLREFRMGERFERLERFGRNAERFARNDSNGERIGERFARNDWNGERNTERFARNDSNGERFTRNDSLV
jgi:hypothetical protein